MPVTVMTTSDRIWTNQWRTTLEMTPGPHQLVATALRPSGLYTTNATVNYTNSAADTMQDVYSADGALTQRVSKKSEGTTNRTQTLSWDAKGRLFKVTERDDQNSSYNWQAVYDGLGRRLQTTAIIVTNGVAISSQPNVISQYYDPQVEFLELGVTVAGKTTWKICGPDLNGVYGGLNGTGGFDAIVPGPDSFWPTLSNARGNLHAVFDVTHSTLTWNAERGRSKLLTLERLLWHSWAYATPAERAVRRRGLSCDEMRGSPRSDLPRGHRPGVVPGPPGRGLPED